MVQYFLMIIPEVEVRVSGAAVSEHLSRERSTPPLPKARRSTRRSKKPTRFSPRVAGRRVSSGSECDSASASARQRVKSVSEVCLGESDGGMPHLSDTDSDSDGSEDEDEDFVPKSHPSQVPRAPRKSAAEFFAEVSPAPASGNPHARGRAAAAASVGVAGAQGGRGGAWSKLTKTLSLTILEESELSWSRRHIKSDIPELSRNGLI